MTPHRALFIPEVLQQIFEATNVYDWEDDEDMALARCARVCTRFYEPAIRVLWRNLRNVLPLMRLFSSFKQVKTQERSTWYLTYDITGDISARERDRFLAHAVHVRSLDNLASVMDYGWVIGTGTWAFLERAFHDMPPLFPHLRTLALGVDAATPASALFFLSPSLRKLAVSWETCGQPDVIRSRQEWTALWNTLIASVVARVPQLPALTLIAGSDCPVTSLRAIEPFFKLQSLRNFALTLGYDENVAVDPDDLQRLADGALERFEISGRLGIPLGLYLSTVVYHHLTHFILGQHDGSNVTAFDHFAAPALRHLNIMAYEYSGVADIRRTCDAWRRSFPSLQNVHIWCNINVEAGDLHEPSHPISYAIAPLLRLQALQAFTLTWSGCGYPVFEVNDRELLILATAWPALTSLSLGAPGGRRRGGPVSAAASVTPVGLSAMAARCSRLRRLSLPSVECSFAGIADVERLAQASYPLEKLSFDHWTIEDTDMPFFTEFLNRVFPYLLESP